MSWLCGVSVCWQDDGSAWGRGCNYWTYQSIPGDNHPWGAGWPVQLRGVSGHKHKHDNIRLRWPRQSFSNQLRLYILDLLVGDLGQVKSIQEKVHSKISLFYVWSSESLPGHCLGVCPIIIRRKYFKSSKNSSHDSQGGVVGLAVGEGEIFN